MSKDKAQMRGIVVVGDTLEQAKGFYAAVATGNDVLVLESANGEMQIVTASVSTSGIQILDPLTGEELVPVTAETGVIESLASASETSVEAQYVQCTAGCNSHIIADDAALLSKCPACASDLPDLENPNVKPNQTEGQAGQSEALIAFASSFEEASQQYVALVKGETEPHAFQCDDVVVACASAMNFNIYQGVEAVASAHVPVTMAAIASSATETGENIPAHHFMCVSKSCGTHVVASDESPLFCPGCSAGLIDPADIATASDDDEEEDEEDFDDLNDDEEDEEESEEDEDEEDFDDEEEEDDDEAITLSVSSAKPAGGVRKKVKAVASTEPQVAAEPLVAVAASFVAIAATDMTVESVDVAYAAIAGDSRWFAFHNGIPFAQALASTSKVENFASDVFGRTFKAIAAEKGVATAMTDLGFTEIKPEINVEKFVQAEVTSQVESRVQQIAEASNRDAAEFNTRFLAAIATASQGIASGFYKGEAQNPISVALASALEDAGITGGADLVAQCFARHGDAYHSALVAKASQIMQYDLTVQNQMAQAVSEHQNPQAHGEVSVSSSLPVGRPVVDRQVQQVQHRETSIASSQASTDDFSKRLAGLSFGRKSR